MIIFGLIVAFLGFAWAFVNFLMCSSHPNGGDASMQKSMLIGGLVFLGGLGMAIAGWFS
jgi:uncharacterized membrane protein